MDLTDTWIPWTEECEKIPYKTTEQKGIGNGEMRIGFISGVSPKGQNEPYDFDIPNYGKYDLMTPYIFFHSTGEKQFIIFGFPKILFNIFF